jgi:DNA primase catalytic core
VTDKSELIFFFQLKEKANHEPMEIAEIKSRLPLSRVLQHYGLEPDRNSRLCCPFHDDKTPSLQVYSETNTCYCFSTNCKTHGRAIDVIDFILHKEGCSKHEAILKAKALIGGEIPPAKTQPAKTTDPERTAVLARMFSYFKNGAGNSRTAKAYLSERCLDADKIEVGYNSGQSHHGERKDEALIRACVEHGLLIDKGAKSRTGGKAYRPFGKGCIVFALRGEAGQIEGMYFRSTKETNGAKPHTGRHFYLKNRSGLYPGYPSSNTQRLILTESIIDAATLHQIKEVENGWSLLALYGTNGLTAEHLTAIKNLPGLEEVTFFFDGDEAGRAAEEKYTALLQKEAPGIKLSSVSTPEGEDVNSLAQKEGLEALPRLVASRKPIELFLSNEKPVEASNENKKPASMGLDTSIPHNLKYEGLAARYEIKGFKTDQLDSLKASLRITAKESGQGHRAKLDLYEYSQMRRTAGTAAERLGIRADLVEKDFNLLADLLEAYRERRAAGGPEERPGVEVPAATASKCLAFLKQPGLLENINGLIGQAGIVGEQESRLLLFAIAASYKMPDTLHALIQGSSGSGKTQLMKTVSSLMPPEDTKRYTRVTDNSFYNQGEHFFVHKLVCFEDLDGLKEEAQLAVRELQSNEILVTSTSIKDKNGQISGGERVVRGPIASLSCTTKGELYEDNISRCFVVAVDESKAQTRRIITHQNQLAAGLIDKQDQQKAKSFLQNCVRLLEPLEVTNPYAHKIHLPEGAHKLRRLNELYQSFVRQLALLHQYQRKRDSQGRLIAQKEDLQSACDILFESILLKVDELDGPLRQFFEQLKAYVSGKGEGYEFTRFEARQATGVSKTQQHHYINKLVELEYLQQWGHANRGYRYRIAHWDNMARMRAEVKQSLHTQLQQL